MRCSPSTRISPTVKPAAAGGAVGGDGPAEGGGAAAGDGPSEAGGAAGADGPAAAGGVAAGDGPAAAGGAAAGGAAAGDGPSEAGGVAAGADGVGGCGDGVFACSGAGCARTDTPMGWVASATKQINRNSIRTRRRPHAVSM